ncbi:MAG TPA: TetR/AcrR family transcriptional regulator [Jatrophihabitantaceae bacterium]|nr:TetR/AcrR family transcriptional regulator [Jatrophihabitantaceae bacterium]
MTSTVSDGRRVRGARTRTAVLDAAVAAASVSGLDAMSLGQLANSLGVSKSGLFAHWTDKEQLQLAVVDHARQQWTERIVEPALRRPRGLPRLWAMHELRMAFYTDGVLPGGCFFAAVGPEFDDRPGLVRQRIADAMNAYNGLLVTLAQKAVEVGHLRPDVDPELLAFEMQACDDAVIRHSRLLGSERAIELSRRAVLDRLRSLATDQTLLPEV